MLPRKLRYTFSYLNGSIDQVLEVETFVHWIKFSKRGLEILYGYITLGELVLLMIFVIHSLHRFY